MNAISRVTAAIGSNPPWSGSRSARVEVAYARRHVFRRMVAHTRASNAAMIALNKSFGFRVVRKLPDYYFEPAEAAVEMALVLTP